LKIFATQTETVSILERRSTREEGAVDSVYNRLCADLATTEETAVKSFDSVLAALDAVELEVNVALGIGI